MVRFFCEENRFLKKTKNPDYMAIEKKMSLWWQDNQACVWLKLWFQICFHVINWCYFGKDRSLLHPWWLFTLACLCRALCVSGKTAEGPKFSFWWGYFSFGWIPWSILWPEEHQHQPRGGGEGESRAACVGKCSLCWPEVNWVITARGRLTLPLPQLEEELPPLLISEATSKDERLMLWYGVQTLVGFWETQFRNHFKSVIFFKIGYFENCCGKGGIVYPVCITP